MGLSSSKSSKFANSEKAHVKAFLSRNYQLHVGSYVQASECYRAYMGDGNGMVDVNYAKFVAIMKSIKPYSLCYNSRHAVLLDSVPKPTACAISEPDQPVIDTAPSMALPDLPAHVPPPCGAWASS